MQYNVINFQNKHDFMLYIHSKLYADTLIQDVCCDIDLKLKQLHKHPQMKGAKEMVISILNNQFTTINPLQN